MGDLDEDDFEYGKLYEHKLDETANVAVATEIWPTWTEGVPEELRWASRDPAFILGRVQHRDRPTQRSLKLDWQRSHKLADLEKNYRSLPSVKYSNQWDGVYRIFVPDKSIGRLCADDPTGTLYIGKAGSKRNWSILRTRIQDAISRRHHATSWWSYHATLRDKHPWETLAIQWAYVAERLDYQGEMIKVAGTAESVLLRCYRDTFGELPPLNEKG